MIFDMKDYRSTDGEIEDNSSFAYRRAYGNTAPALQLVQVEAEPATWLKTPELPEMNEFDDIDAREFIERVYSMATKI